TRKARRKAAAEELAGELAKATDAEIAEWCKDISQAAQAFSERAARGEVSLADPQRDAMFETHEILLDVIDIGKSRHALRHPAGQFRPRTPLEAAGWRDAN